MNARAQALPANDGPDPATLPFNIDAEQALIGALLYDNSRFDAASHVTPAMFAEGLHGRMWEAIAKMVRTDRLAEPIAMLEQFRGDPALEELGGLAYLGELVDRAPSAELAGHYADIVADTALRREIVRLAHDTAQEARTGQGEAVLASLEHRTAELARTGSAAAQAVPVGLTALEMIEAAWEGRYRGVSTGLASLDRVTAGIREDDVWFIGGRTSMGKSVLATVLARAIAQQGRGVIFNSLEMPMREVQARLAAEVAYDQERRYDGAGFENIRYGDILRGRGTPEQHARAVAAARKLADLPLVVNDKGGLSIEDIRTQAQRQFRAWEKAGVPRGAVVIDHIGLVRPHTKRGDSKAAETADVVNELKALAKYLKAPVIALCQVNRNTENRSDHRPTLGDLNWSGAIEQIADLICLLYREAYYLERSANREDQDRAITVENEMELLIHKNRSGPICTVKAFVDIASNAIIDLPEEGRR
jgi:replicative DNA helicase